MGGPVRPGPHCTPDRTGADHTRSRLGTVGPSVVDPAAHPAAGSPSPRSPELDPSPGAGAPRTAP